MEGGGEIKNERKGTKRTLNIDAFGHQTNTCTSQFIYPVSRVILQSGLAYIVSM